MANPKTDQTKAEMQAAADRLKQARGRLFRTASDAAKHLRVPQPTYLAHENASRGMRPESAQYYAEQFGVPFNWLWLGQGPMAVSEAKVAPAGSLRRHPLQHVNDNPLLNYFDVQIVTGGIALPVDTASDVGPYNLPPAAMSRGYVPVLRRKINAGMPGQGQDASATSTFEPVRLRSVKVLQQELLLQSFLWVPSDFLSRDTMFAFVVGEDMLLNAGDHCLVDPASRDLTGGGRFAFLTPNGLLPMLVQPLRRSRSHSLDDLLGTSATPGFAEQVMLWTDRSSTPTTCPWSDLYKRFEDGRLALLGRIVGALTKFSRFDDQVLETRLQSAAQDERVPAAEAVKGR
jgi:hypothetical protein